MVLVEGQNPVPGSGSFWDEQKGKIRRLGVIRRYPECSAVHDVQLTTVGIRLSTIVGSDREAVRRKHSQTKYQQHVQCVSQTPRHHGAQVHHIKQTYATYDCSVLSDILD